MFSNPIRVTLGDYTNKQIETMQWFILFQPFCHHVPDNHWTTSDIPLTCHEFLGIFKFWGNSYVNLKETEIRTSNALANPIFMFSLYQLIDK